MTDDILPKHIKDRVIAELDKIDGIDVGLRLVGRAGVGIFCVRQRASPAPVR